MNYEKELRENVVDKNLKKVLEDCGIIDIIIRLEENCQIPVSMYDNLDFMNEINEKTEFYARLDSSTDFIIID